MEQIIVTHVGGSTLKLQSKDNVSNITKAVQTVEKLGADTVDISVVSATKLVFSIGDKITIFGRDYTLNTPANEKKISESNFTYDLHFEGVQYDLLRASYSVNVDTTNGKVQDLNGDSLTGDIKMFLDVLVANANRVFPGKWSIGTYPSGTETRTETFNDTDNCLSVLQSLCNEDKYNTEFSIAIGVDGARTINIGATGKTHTYTFEYGKGKGLNELVREKQSSSNIITRLNVFGSSRNINTAKYRAFRLCLPGKTKSQSFLENADSIAAYGVWEGTKVFEDVYPRRTGVVSGVGSSELVFTDSSMDFDLNEKEGDATKYLISGSSAKVHFNSGALAGYEFDLTSYNHTTKVFTVKPITDENGYTFPSPTTSAFRFAVGDKYVILDISLPKSYEDAAEAELEIKGNEYYDKYSQPLVQYGLTLDSFFLRDVVGEEAESNIIWPGDYIPIKDTDLNVDKLIRVKGISRNLLADYDYNITISDLGTKVSTITSIITSIGGIDKLIQMNGLNDPARARRNYLSAQEVLGMIFDTEGDFYTDKIKPLSIETSMLSVGAKSMQFDLTGTVINPNYGGAKNRIVYVGGILSHSAILDSSNNPRIWNITDGDIVLSTDAAYYIYAKCIKVGTGASLLFSTSKITVESDQNYYHFLIGIANSVNPQNARSLALMYGFSTVNGRFITAGRIQSGDGLTYFDLDTGEIGGRIIFKSGDEYKEVGAAITDAVNNLQIGGRNVCKKTDALHLVTAAGGIISRISDYEWHLIGAQNDNVVMRILNVITGNGLWTVSFDVKGSQGYAIQVSVDICDSYAGTAYSTNDNNYSRVSFTGNVQDYSSDVYNFVDINLPQWVYYFIRNIKIEKGNKATDWTPAIEDVDAKINEANYLKEALKNDTSIEGGLVSTTLLKVGAVNQSGEYNENAGINGAGQGSDTPRVYSGGSLDDAVARVAGNTTKDMAVITEGGKLFASAGEIAGFLMTQNGIEKEKSITEQDSTTFIGKFKLDWVNQIINFLRDGSSRVLISAKKLTSGIPTPTNFTVANGTWQNTVELNRNGLSLSHTSILGPRTLVAPGAYDAKETLSLRAYRGLYSDTWLININFQVTLNIWKTDVNNSKISLLSSSTENVNLYSNTNVALVTTNLTASLSIENETGLSHEIVLIGTMIEPTEIPYITYSKVIYQTSLIYTASQESFEIGYSGLRILAQNLWFYFNTKDSENKHLRMRGNAALVSKNANTSFDLNDVSLTASRITLQGVIVNLVNKTQNYTIGASDKEIAGIKVVNAAVNVVITFPDLNATDAQGNYYNDNRELTVVATGRNVTVYPNSGQSIRNSTYVTINANCGYKFIGDRASGNWLFVGA